MFTFLFIATVALAFAAFHERNNVLLWLATMMSFAMAVHSGELQLAAFVSPAWEACFSWLDV